MQVVTEKSRVREAVRPEPFLTGANLLTLSRLPLAGLAWVAPSHPVWMVVLIATAGITDVLDGMLARRAGRRGDGAGVWLDPLCDKVFAMSVLAALWHALRPPAWAIALIATRELILVALLGVVRIVPSLRRRVRWDFRAAPIGKAATVAQFLAIGAILLGHPAMAALAVAAGVLGAAAAAYYVRRAQYSMKIPNQRAV